MTDKFDEFIKSQTKQSQAGDDFQLQPEQEKKMWLGKLAELYSMVAKSLDPYLTSGAISISKSPIELHEELLGSYEADQMEIVVGRQAVRLKPVGTFLIGARGRVDMVGPRGSTRFVIVPPESTKPNVQVTVTFPGEQVKPSPQTPFVPPEKWVWKISTLPPRITYVDLTEETFREALIGVVNGDG